MVGDKPSIWSKRCAVSEDLEQHTRITFDLSFAHPASRSSAQSLQALDKSRQSIMTCEDFCRESVLGCEFDLPGTVLAPVPGTAANIHHRTIG
jgi:hypothetical protein